MNPLDQARALQRLADEFDLTHLEVADAVGKSRTTVTNLLRLTSLNKEVQVLLENGDIEMGHARTLLAVGGKLQNEVARSIVAKGLSVRETEHLIRRYKQQTTDNTTAKKAPLDPNTLKLQEDLSQKLGAKVAIKSNAKGKGQLLIHYNNFDELDGILAHIS